MKVNLLNFMATVAGLEDQMQGIAMQSEQPVLSETRSVGRSAPAYRVLPLRYLRPAHLSCTQILKLPLNHPPPPYYHALFFTARDW